MVDARVSGTVSVRVTSSVDGRRNGGDMHTSSSADGGGSVV